MEEMQSIVKRIKADHDDLEAWQRLGELVDDPQKKNDCREQVARINKEWGPVAMPAAAPARTRAHAKTKLLGRQLSLIIIIASNLLPIFGILFLGWSMGSVMILYWVENVMVGFFTILKIVFADEQAGGWLARIPLMLFFCVHFGGFCVGHLIFIIALFMPKTLVVWNLHNTPVNLLKFLAELWLPILGMFISYSIYFYQHYLGDGIYQRVSLTSLMGEPYPRIMSMHFVLIIAGFLVVALGSPIGAILLLVALKTGAEMAFYRRSAAKWRTSARKIRALLS
jgi:hypothetical protein